MRATGRSILIAAAVLISAVAWLAQQQGAQRPPLRMVKSAMPAAMSGPPPLARDVLTSGVPLSAAQRRALETLAMQWERESTPLEKTVHAGSAELDRFAVKTQAEGLTSPAEPQQRSAELRQPSAELRARLRAQSDSALAVLTDAQRRQMKTTSGGMR